MTVVTMVDDIHRCLQLMMSNNDDDINRSQHGYQIMMTSSLMILNDTIYCSSEALKEIIINLW